MSTEKDDVWTDICPPVTGAAARQRGAVQHHGQSRSDSLQKRFPKENVDFPWKLGLQMVSIVLFDRFIQNPEKQRDSYNMDK